MIRARLALAIRLIDTTTGREVTDTEIRFVRDGVVQKPMNKGSGIWVFTGEEREDFSLLIEPRGYDPYELEVSYETLDPKLPICDVFLMPSEKNRIGGEVISIKGTLSGLKSIEAVRTDRPLCLFHEVTEKRGVISLSLMPKTPGGKVVLENMRYALMTEDGTRYEVFDITGTQTPTQFIISDHLTDEHKVNDKVGRIIYGRAGPGGEYLLKARDDGSTLPYIIRFTTDKGEYFRTIDLHLESGEIDLMENAVKKVEPETRKETEDE